MVIIELLFVVRLLPYSFPIFKNLGRVKVILLVIIELLLPHLHPQRFLVCCFIDVLIDFIAPLLLTFIIYVTLFAKVILFVKDFIVFIDEFIVFIILIFDVILAFIVVIHDFIVFIVIFINVVILIFLAFIVVIV